MVHGRLLRLGFDIDGVLANFVEGFLGCLNKACGTSYIAEQWLDYGDKNGPSFMTPEQWSAGWDEVTKTGHFWAALRPYFDVDFDLLERQMDGMEYGGYFFTRRKDLQAEGCCNDASWLSKTWLAAQGLNSHTSLICTSSSDRISQLKAAQIDAYVDDWGDQFLKVADAGIDAYLLDRPYNQEVKTEKRVKTVHEFVARAKARFAQPLMDASAEAPPIPSTGYLEHTAVAFSIPNGNVMKAIDDRCPSRLWGGGNTGYVVVPKEPVTVTAPTGLVGDLSTVLK